MRDYTIMDWVTLGGIATVIVAIVGVIITAFRDTKALSKEHETLTDKLSKEHEVLANELSKENESIKDDTKEIRDTMLEEKNARKNLYKNTTRAKEIPNTIDITKEVVEKNAELNNELSDLKVENAKIKSENSIEYFRTLLSSLESISNGLSKAKNSKDPEFIQRQLEKTEKELSRYT
jgi:archaellum component FlaG (FlaF/FlaG flagellin family)